MMSAPYNTAESWGADKWKTGGTEYVRVSDPVARMENMQLYAKNAELKSEIKRLEDIEKKYNVLKRLADRMKADSKRLFDRGVLKRCLRNG